MWEIGESKKSMNPNYFKDKYIQDYLCYGRFRRMIKIIICNWSSQNYCVTTEHLCASSDHNNRHTHLLRNFYNETFAFM